MNTQLFKLILPLTILGSCSFLESEPMEIPDPPDLELDIMYHKEPGLMRFVEDRGLPLKDTTFLIIANNKSCNCGTAGIMEIDSMVRTHGNYPRIWILNDNEPVFKATRKPGDIILDGRDYDMDNYGFSGIYPQLFTFYDNKLIQYDKLMYSRH